MDNLILQFLGCGDIFSSGGRMQTCFHLRLPDRQVLLDCGTTALVSMQRFGVIPNEIDLILLSHLHGDHFGGLPFFILQAQLMGKRSQPLRVAGPPGTKERVFQAMEVFFPGSSRMPLRFPLEFLELSPQTATPIGSLQVTPYPVIHPSGAPAYALRVSCAGKTITYSGDTEWTETLIEAARGADLFICEAYFYEKQVKYHLDYRTLLAHRPEIDCRRLIITHLNNDLLQHLDQVTVEVAEDGKIIAL